MALDVSIIVPCYNVESYLNETLASVQSQTFKNWECICVDDGSTDRTLAIIEAYTAKDERFHCVVKKNGGNSSARNAGMRKAHGKYLFFLDSDDLLFSDTLQNLFDSNKNIDADVVWGQHCEFEEYPVRLEVRDTAPKCIEGGVLRVFIRDYFGQVMVGGNNPFKGVPVMVWNKLIAREKFNDLWFDEVLTQFGEDTMFSARLFTHFNLKRIVISPLVTYAYRNRSGSLYRQRTLDWLIGYASSYAETMRILKRSKAGKTFMKVCVRPGYFRQALNAFVLTHEVDQDQKTACCFRKACWKLLRGQGLQLPKFSTWLILGGLGYFEILRKLYLRSALYRKMKAFVD